MSRFEQILEVSSFPDEIKTKITESKDLSNMLELFFSLHYTISTNADAVPDRFKEEVKLMVKMYVDAMYASPEEAPLLPILIKALWVRSRISLAQHIPTTTDTEPRSLFKKFCEIITAIGQNNEDLIDKLNLAIFKLAESLIESNNIAFKKIIISAGWEFLRIAIQDAIPSPIEEWQRKVIEELSA